MDQLDRLDEAAEEMSVIQDFLEWLCSKCVILDSKEAVAGVPVDLEKLVLEFFEIDPVKLEAERKEVLKEARRLL